MGGEDMIGAISMFAGTYAPQGYLWCNGQSLKVMEHQALYSVLGTVYGGDGRVEFHLPDLREHDKAGKPVDFPHPQWSSAEPSGIRPGWLICIDGIYPIRP